MLQVAFAILILVFYSITIKFKKNLFYQLVET